MENSILTQYSEPKDKKKVHKHRTLVGTLVSHRAIGLTILNLLSMYASVEHIRKRIADNGNQVSFF